VSACEGFESKTHPYSQKGQKRVRETQVVMPENFGDRVTMDRIIARSARNRGFAKQSIAFALIDAATDFRWGKGFRNKTGVANLEVMQKFQGPDPKDKIKYVYSDAAPEILYATKAMGIRGVHDTSTPGDSQGHGVAGNNNRDIKMGTAALLTHAGIPLASWPLALLCYCFGRNAAVIDGTSPYRKRFGENFDQTKMFPFGAEIKFIPSKITGDAAMQFEGATRPGIFLGYAVNSIIVWSGVYLVAHMRQFGTMNYRSGKNKENDKNLVVQIVRDVRRAGDSKDAAFAFPLKKHHDAAFNTPEGW
jgi:hypothetical protein